MRSLTIFSSGARDRKESLEREQVILAETHLGDVVGVVGFEDADSPGPNIDVFPVSLARHVVEDPMHSTRVSLSRYKTLSHLPNAHSSIRITCSLDHFGL